MKELKRVLVVEDDPACQEAIRTLFAAACEITQCYNFHDARNALAAQQALAKLRPEADHAKPYDLIMLDIGLPDISIREVIRQMSELAPDVPTVVLSGMLNSGLVRLASKHNMVAVHKDVMVQKESFQLAILSASEASKKMRISSLELAKQVVQTAAEKSGNLTTAEDYAQRDRSRAMLIVTTACAILPFYLFHELPKDAWGEYAKWTLGCCALVVFGAAGILVPLLNFYNKLKNKE